MKETICHTFKGTGKVQILCKIISSLSTVTITLVIIKKGIEMKFVWNNR